MRTTRRRPRRPDAILYHALINNPITKLPHRPPPLHQLSKFPAPLQHDSRRILAIRSKRHKIVTQHKNHPRENQKSKIQNPKSKIKNQPIPKSQIPNPPIVPRLSPITIRPSVISNHKSSIANRNQKS
jgi:hypothetical protein